MIDLDAIWSALRTIDDPEMPISIVDLGIVAGVRADAPTNRPAGACEVAIDVLPTFVGCPALHMIQEMIEQKVGAIPGVAAVRVSFLYDPPWSVDRISAAGRESLRRFGVDVPVQGGAAELRGPQLIALGLPGAAGEVNCPLCGSADTTMESAFGPTRCKMIYYCQACRNSFERMKRV